MLTPGGSAANLAVWAQRCGLETHFIGKIGRDRFGQLAREDLDSETVIHHLVETEAHKTGSVAVFVDQTGERSMVSGRGADFYLIPSELPRSVITSATHLHLTAWSFFTDPPRSASRIAAQIARQSNLTISFDPASFQMIQEMGVDQFLSWTKDLSVNILFPNYDEGRALTGFDEPDEIVRSLANIYDRALIILKLDADGALVFDGKNSTQISPATNNLVDATGAGDSFAGAFLAHYLVANSPVDAAIYATKVAAWVIEHLGARPATDARLQQIIRSL